MIDIDDFLDKYKDQVVFVEEKRESLDIIKQLVDVKECDISILNPIHLQLTKENAKKSIYYNDSPIKLHFYEVLKNEKSTPYYKDILQNNMYRAYFEVPTVYFIYEESIGILESNSNLLKRTCKILKGITQEDIDQKSMYLFDYLSVFHVFEE